MHKRGFFIKIYLCFWLTIVLVMSTQIALDHIDESSPFNRMQQHVTFSLGLYGQTYLAYLLSGNSHAVDQLATQYARENGVEAYLLDSQLHRFNGAPAPQNIYRIAEQALRSGKSEHFREKGLDVMAVPIVAPDGMRYIVIGTLHHKGPIHLPPHFGNPNMLLRICAVFLISGVVCYLLARYLVAPLVALQDATTRFAAGEHSVRIGSRIRRRRDETAELAQAFDEMAERIESLMKLQRQLIGDISHELRSPLARLNVALDLARQNTGVEAEHALNRIEEEAEELNEMIGELLTLTRLESGNEPIETSLVNVSELVREIAEDGDFEAQGSNRGVRLTICDKCIINGNNDLLRRAIENVVRNAIHYTYENTEVEISVNRQPSDKVKIIVRDHGTGVPEGELGNIFRPFYRTSESRERQSGGAGLGLAISERAIMLHHGTIVAENAVGGGLSVCIELAHNSG